MTVQLAAVVAAWAGPFHRGTPAEVLERTYPLTRIVTPPEKYLPLTAEAAAVERDKLRLGDPS